MEGRQKRSRSPSDELGQKDLAPTVVAEQPAADDHPAAGSSFKTLPGAVLMTNALKKEQSINLHESITKILRAKGEGIAEAEGNLLLGEIKWLITDFTVRELDEVTGAPLQLSSTSVPAEIKLSSEGATGIPKTGKDISLEDLREGFNKVLPSGSDDGSSDDIQQLFDLAQKPVKNGSIVLSPSFDSKELRGEVHKAVRSTLGSHFESTAFGDGNTKIKVAYVGAKGERAFQQRNRRNQWPAGRGEFLHFTAYKENIDSASMLRLVASKLSISQKSIQFSGTKDKRGVTLQRLACHKMEAERVAGLNKVSFGKNSAVRLGDFEYKTGGLQLGKLRGNFFSIVVRKVEVLVEGSEESTTRRIMEDEARAYASYLQEKLSQYGFINYFGPQRFGTTSIPTSTVGCALMGKKYRDVVLMVLKSKAEFVPAIQQAIELGENGDRWAEALAACPHFCYLERDMLGVLAKNPRDFPAAVSAIPRPTAMLYCHAVQSLIWNEMASRRARQSPTSVLVGDLVLAEGTAVLSPNEEEGADDVPVAKETTGPLPKVHTVTQEDIDNNRFVISQVLLPVPGPDSELQFPRCSSVSREDYFEYAKELGVESSLLDSSLSEGDSLTKKFHFHGTYRNLIAIPASVPGREGPAVQIEVKKVASVGTPCVETDLKKLEPELGSSSGKRNKEARKLQMEGELNKEEDDAVPPQEEAVGSTVKTEEGSDSGSGEFVFVVSFALGAGSYATSLLRELVVLVRST